jgi:hypothetical protein
MELNIAEFGPLDEKPPWEKYKKDIKSRLVIASNNGTGCVLYAIGSCWEVNYEGVGSYCLVDNGLDDAPDGISIWEGKLETKFSLEGDCDTFLAGEFRELTEEEWKLLAKGEAPWDEKNWLCEPETQEEK